jgi:hypothetical protein
VFAASPSPHIHPTTSRAIVDHHHHDTAKFVVSHWVCGFDWIGKEQFNRSLWNVLAGSVIQHRWKQDQQYNQDKANSTIVEPASVPTRPKK